MSNVHSGKDPYHYERMLGYLVWATPLFTC